MLQSITQLMTLTGISRATIKARLANLPHQQGPGNSQLFESRDALPALFGRPDARLDPAQEKAGLDRVRRELAELDLQCRRLELLPADEVAAAWSAQVLVAKGRFMAMPARIAPALLRQHDLRGIEGTLKEAIFEIMRELSGQPIEGTATACLAGEDAADRGQ